MGFKSRLAQRVLNAQMSPDTAVGRMRKLAQEVEDLETQRNEYESVLQKVVKNLGRCDPDSMCSDIGPKVRDSFEYARAVLDAYDKYE
jgi:hypothetical protein